jgi:hypothetical protein
MILVFSNYSPAAASSLALSLSRSLFLGLYIPLANLYPQILNLRSSLECSTEFGTHNSSYKYSRYALVVVSFPGNNRLCGPVVRVLGYRSGGPGSILGITRKKN